MAHHRRRPFPSIAWPPRSPSNPIKGHLSIPSSHCFSPALRYPNSEPRATPHRSSPATAFTTVAVTPGFKAKTRCSSYVCPGSGCHTYGQNVNTENQYLYYIVSYYKYLLQVLNLLNLGFVWNLQNTVTMGCGKFFSQFSNKDLGFKIKDFKFQTKIELGAKLG
jgi:hypothetical protein